MKPTKPALALGMFIASLLMGITGFILIEKFSFIDAFYMTVITISTVGFTEVKELTEAGRVFTSFYIIFNLAIYAYGVSIITQYLLDGEVKHAFERLRKEKKIRKMINHVIVCGFGRNGSKAAEELVKNKIPVVVIELEFDERKNDPLFRNTLFISGNATEDELLLQAGIGKAKGIIISLPSDADNVFITLTARELSPDILIIARASDPQSEKKLKRAGANHVVMPDYIGGLHMAGLFIQKELSSLIYTSSAPVKADCRLEEIVFKDIGDHFAGKRISEINTVLKDAMIVGYKRKDGIMIVNPSDEITFEPDDLILMVHGS